MAEWWDWDDSGSGSEMYTGGSPTFNEGWGSLGSQADMPWAYPMPADTPGWEEFTGWGDPTGPGTSGDSSTGFWGSLGRLLTGVGGAAAGAVGAPGGGGIGGPLLSALGSLGGGAIGSNAANEAARLQSQALNRGIDLQTAQWLQQQGNLAPYLQAGQQGLSTLQGLAGREQPAAPGATPAYTGGGVPLPSVMPGWTPQTYGGYTPGATPQASQYGYQGPGAPQAADYQWHPGQGPQAADYRYTPGNIPSAAANRWTPGQGPSAQDYRYTPGQTPDAAQYASQAPNLYRGAMPGTQVPTLSGQELLAQDPGAAFRQSEARKALEGSAAARGDLLSGGTLQALQSRSQDLASQEYGNAWQRMMARNTEQYGRDWGQYQQRWGEGVTGAQLGLQTQAQNFGQAMSAAQLREQLQQTATQQGWSQAQTEAVFREQMAQQASQQGFGQQMSEADMRERVNQVATQQGWSQAQAEAVFREQMAQQASQQGLSQAMAAQGQQFQQGLAGQQFDWQRAMQEAQQREQSGQFAWQAGTQAGQLGQKERQQFESDLYNRLMGQNTLQYGRDTYANETDYARQQALYRQQLGQSLLPWEQASTLAGLGQKATGMYGEQSAYNSRGISDLLANLGVAQGTGAAAQGASWNRALGGATNATSSLLANLNA